MTIDESKYNAPRIMVVLPHPDDESYTVVGTLLKLKREIKPDPEIVLLCATAGESGIPEGRTPDIRRHEMEHVTQLLGAQLGMLGFRNGGMAGLMGRVGGRVWINENDFGVYISRIEKHDPVVEELCRAYEKLFMPVPPTLNHHSPKCPLTPLEARIVEHIRDFRPDVIIGMEPYGVTGHNEHIMVAHATTSAYLQASDEKCFPGQKGSGLAPHATPRLFYSVFDCEREGMPEVWKGLLKKYARRRASVNLPVLDPVLSVDLSDYTEEKWKLIKCHASQMRPREKYLDKAGKDERKKLLGIEQFFLAHSRPESECRVHPALENTIFGTSMN
ncbi:PIG-L deacetylase family protein [Candidatus Hydrogenedentota bacterium]